MLVISLHKKFVTTLLEVVFFHRKFENNIVLKYKQKFNYAGTKYIFIQLQILEVIFNLYF